MEQDPANPYAPPVSPGLGTPTKAYDITECLPAGNGKRFGNYLIDLIMVYAVTFALGVLMGLLSHFVFPGLWAWFEENEELAGYILGTLAMILYYGGMEWIFGLTVGKLVTGTRVVREDGTRPSLGAILGRTLSRFVPFEPFSFFGGRPGGWHDHWSGTMVIDVRNRP